jgi:hypothetical protein
MPGHGSAGGGQVRAAGGVLGIFILGTLTGAALAMLASQSVQRREAERRDAQSSATAGTSGQKRAPGRAARAVWALLGGLVDPWGYFGGPVRVTPDRLSFKEAFEREARELEATGSGIVRPAQVGWQASTLEQRAFWENVTRG